MSEENDPADPTLHSLNDVAEEFGVDLGELREEGAMYGDIFGAIYRATEKPDWAVSQVVDAVLEVLKVPRKSPVTRAHIAAARARAQIAESRGEEVDEKVRKLAELDPTRLKDN